MKKESPTKFPSPDSAADRILKLLAVCANSNDGICRLPEILSLRTQIACHTRRISDLRKYGFKIENSVEHGKVVKSSYKMDIDQAKGYLAMNKKSTKTIKR
jgi:hypothetical protein